MLNGIKEPHPALLKWAQQHTIECISAVVPVCPTCGSVHLVGDCHGKAGSAAIVADNEEVKQKRIYKMSKPAYRPRLPLTLKERIEADGRTVEQLIEAALSAKENDE